jgi:hypothetical protein
MMTKTMIMSRALAVDRTDDGTHEDDAADYESRRRMGKSKSSRVREVART